MTDVFVMTDVAREGTPAPATSPHITIGSECGVRPFPEDTQGTIAACLQGTIAGQHAAAGRHHRHLPTYMPYRCASGGLDFRALARGASNGSYQLVKVHNGAWISTLASAIPRWQWGGRWRSGAIRGNQGRSRATRGNQGCAGAPRGNQRRSGAIGGNQGQSGATKGDEGR